VEPDDAVPAANSCAVHGIDGNGSSTVREDEAPGGAWTNVAAMVINFATIRSSPTSHSSYRRTSQAAGNFSERSRDHRGHTGIYGGTDRLAGASGTEILLWAPREETHLFAAGP
jgi:hypothetical protein